MPGHTGKRPRPAGRCTKCGMQIKDAEFLRDRKGDEHITCPVADLVRLLPEEVIFQAELRSEGWPRPRNKDAQ